MRSRDKIRLAPTRVTYSKPFGQKLLSSLILVTTSQNRLALGSHFRSSTLVLNLKVAPMMRSCRLPLLLLSLFLSALKISGLAASASP